MVGFGGAIFLLLELPTHGCSSPTVTRRNRSAAPARTPLERNRQLAAFRPQKLVPRRTDRRRRPAWCIAIEHCGSLIEEQADASLAEAGRRRPHLTPATTGGSLVAGPE